MKALRAGQRLLSGRPLATHRGFRSSVAVKHGHFEWEDPKSTDEVVRLTIICREGKRHEMQGKVGDNLLYLSHRWRQANESIALEGACEASLACSTCHVILNDAHFDRLDEASEDEEDMLDLASCLTSTSRLGCQIILSKELEGMEVTFPQYSRNFAVVLRTCF